MHQPAPKERSHCDPGTRLLLAAPARLLALQTVILLFGTAGLSLWPLQDSATITLAGREFSSQALWAVGVAVLLWILFALLLAGIRRELKNIVTVQAQRGTGITGDDSRSENSQINHASTGNSTLRELELARAQALQASKLKSDLIARASHELLTPLNSISGFAGILQREELDVGERSEYIDLIADNAQQLETLVNDLISFADRHSNAINIVYKYTDIGELLSSIGRSFRNTLQEHGLAFKLDIGALYGVEVETDAARLRQMLSNLLVNAIRNTAQGSISLRASLDQHNPNSAMLVIAVEDTGCGIPADRLASLRKQLASDGRTTRLRLRKPGEELEKIPAAQTPGLGFGLGLPIVADLAERLGAKLDVISTVNTGSVFTLRLPAREWRRTSGEPDSQAAPPRGKQTIAAGAYALVVDDIESNRRLLQHLLQTAGFACDSAASGAAALALLKQRNYAWVFIDIGMRPMDGPTLLGALRRLPGYQQVPCIACTALHQQEDSRRLREQGFDALLGKPVDAQKIPALAREFGLAPASIATCATATSAPAEKNQGTAAMRHETAGTVQAGQSGSSTVKPIDGLEQASMFDIAGAVAYASGNCDVARELAEQLRRELEDALATQAVGFEGHSARLHHFHQLNGSASLGGTPRLKQLLVRFETLLRRDGGIANDEGAQLQVEIERQQRALLEWLVHNDLEQAFAAVNQA